MNSMQFMEKLKERYSETRRTKDGEVTYCKINAAVFADIRQEVMQYSEQNIENIWYHFVREHTMVSPPNLAIICKIIKEHGIKKEYSNMPRTEYIQRCRKCKSVFSNKSDPADVYICPNCLEDDIEMIPRESVDDRSITFCQSICLISWGEYDTSLQERYESETGEKYTASKIEKCPNMGQQRAYGTMCAIWGKGKSEPECRDCACRNCCVEYNREVKHMAKEAE